MSLKYNINLIHSNIKEFYKETNIKESSDKKFGNYFEINVLHENKNIKMMKLFFVMVVIEPIKIFLRWH